MSEAESESLTAALARMDRPPPLRITTEQDLRDEIADMLVRIAPEYRGNIALRYVGEGRVRLEGLMPVPAERDRLLQTLAAAFPQVPSWDNAIRTADEAGELFMADLRGRGNWELSGTVEGGKLQLRARVPRDESAGWERALLAAARANPVAFRVQVDFAEHREAGPQRVPLPFELRSVVGGAMPYVVLPSGEKLAQGAQWQGWRLSTITATEVTFDNGGRRAVVQR